MGIKGKEIMLEKLTEIFGMIALISMGIFIISLVIGLTVFFSLGIEVGAYVVVVPLLIALFFVGLTCIFGALGFIFS